MSEAQQQALERVRQTLSEHFDSSLVVVSGIEEDGSSDDEYLEYYTHGGCFRAIGLCATTLRFLQDDLATARPERDNDDD